MDIFKGIAFESAGPLVLGDVTDEGVIKDCIIIQEGWGQSGYYDGDSIHRDAHLFKEGLRIFLDHAEGPIEKAGKVMGVLASKGRPDVFEGKKVVRADLQFFKTGVENIDWVKERAKAKAIELSIRSSVDYTMGTREGRRGKVVTAFTEPYSVDVVARGGAGGTFGTIQESAQIGSAVSENGEGDDVALTAEEAAVVGNAMAAALAPQFDAINKSLGELKTTVEESQVVTPVAIKPSDINSKITAAKLTEKAKARVLLAVESEEVATEAFVDGIIDNEVEIAAEALEVAKAELKASGHIFQEAQTTGDNGDAAVASWGVKK